VDLESGKITKWEKLEGVQPLVSTSFLEVRPISLIESDHHGGSPDRGTCLQKRPQSHSAVRSEWYSSGGYAQGLLRS
jgi:hypothetical protein